MYNLDSIQDVKYPTIEALEADLFRTCEASGFAIRRRRISNNDIHGHFTHATYCCYRGGPGPSSKKSTKGVNGKPRNRTTVWAGCSWEMKAVRYQPEKMWQISYVTEKNSRYPKFQHSHELLPPNVAAEITINRLRHAQRHKERILLLAGEGELTYQGIADTIFHEDSAARIRGIDVQNIVAATRKADPNICLPFVGRKRAATEACSEPNEVDDAEVSA